MKLSEDRHSNDWQHCCSCGTYTREFQLGPDSVCAYCVDPLVGKPGRYEGFNSDRSSVAIALILESDIDAESMFQDGWGYASLHGQFHFYIDNEGFVTFEDYDTEEKSRKRWDALYADGWGYQDDDIVVGEDHQSDGCPQIWHNSKKISIWPRKDGTCDDRRVDAAINLHMQQEGWYPNVWDANRYGVRLRKYRVVNLPEKVKNAN